MEKRLLGRSGLTVSEISLGCWAIGGPSWRNGEAVGWSGNDDAASLIGLRRAFDLGINHFDTADVYGDGHSERLLGQFFKEVRRDQVILATKVGWFKGTAAHPMEPLQIRHQFEQSLANLGTDYKERFGSTTNDLVRVFLQYALARSKNACVIPGFKNAAQVEMNAAASSKPLTEEDIAFIRKTLWP